MCYLILLSLITYSNPLRIEVWVNNEDAIYYPDDKLEVYFRANQDCYVAVYDIEVGGKENLIFPRPEQDGWIKADTIYHLPPEAAAYDYVLKGPEGIETIVAIAATNRLPKLYENSPDVVRNSCEIFIKEQAPAKLRIVSSPRKCAIYIEEMKSGDEAYIGETPRTIVLRPGRYSVRIKKLGFLTLTREIKLEPGEQRRVFAELINY